jgi:hypothetical protein
MSNPPFRIILKAIQPRRDVTPGPEAAQTRRSTEREELPQRHFSGLKIRSRDGGFFASFSAGRRGRCTSSPPQLGHLPPSTPSLHKRQNVHSNEQMNASVDSGGRSRLQHSQFGRSCSIG